ncbi:hypothetical protein NBRC10513v2_001831 [Rhodotorula toruloides]
MAGQQNAHRNAQPAQPSLAARMNSGAFLGSYSLGGTPVKAEQKPTLQASPPQPSQGPSLLERTNSSGSCGDGGSLLARIGGETVAETDTGSPGSAGRGEAGRGINLRDRLSKPQQPVATASPVPTRRQSFPPKDGSQANNASLTPPPRPTNPAKRHVRQADEVQAPSHAASPVTLADRIHGSSTSSSAHRLVERPEPPVWQKPAATQPPQGHSFAPSNLPQRRPSSPPRDPRKSPPKGANKPLHPPPPSLTEAGPAYAQAPKVPSIQRLPPEHVAAQTASASVKQTTQRTASRSSEAGTPPLPDTSPVTHSHSVTTPAPAAAVTPSAPSPVAVRPTPAPTSQPPAVTSNRTSASFTSSTPSRQPIPLRPPSSAECGTPPPRPPRSNRDNESGTPPRPPPPTTRPPASASPATPAARSSHKSPSAPSSAAPRTPKSEPTSPDFRARPLPPPRPPPYVPPAPTKPSLAELQRQADEAREAAQQAEREARRRRDQEAEENRKATAEAEAAEKKRREDEAERVRAEAAEKERARLDAEAKEHARLEAEEKERVRLEAEAKERARLQEEERIKREAEETARKERDAKVEAERVEKERLASERKERERQAKEETRKREEADKKARLDSELEAQEKARQEAKRKEDERKKKERLEEERRAKEAEAKAKLDAELEAQEKERQEEMRKEEERKAELRKEEEREAKIAELAARQAERDRRALAAREEEAKKAERERQELARLAALARKKKEEEERRRQAADDEARKKAEEESQQKAENEEKEKKRAAKEEEEREAEEAEEAMWRKEIPPLWAATTYAWTVRPGCPATLSIVKDRDQVFAKQRKVGTPAVQRTSRKIIAEHMATYTHGTGGRAAYASRVRDYASFCRSVDVPPWPLSTVMIALFCIATAPDGFALSTASNVVIALRNSTRNCVENWQVLPGLSELASWPKADQALTEWKNLLNPIPDEEDSPVETPQGMSPAAFEPAYNVEDGDEEEDEEDVTDEDDEDGADLDEDEVSDSEAKGKPGRSGKRAIEMKKFVLECTKKYPLPDMPAMPRQGQASPNLQALLKAVAVALVPTFGVTPALTNQIIACKRRTDGCPFRISTVKRADGKVVVKANSVYAHNHGIDQRLIADPNWRPAMRNDAVAAAVAKHDKLMATKKSKKRLSDSSELPVAKHPRRESGTVKSDAARRKTATKAAAVERDEPADPDLSTAAKDTLPPPASSDAPRDTEKPTQLDSGQHDVDIERSCAGETGSPAIKASSPSTEPKPTDMTVVKADSSTPAPQLPSQPAIPPASSPASASSYRPSLEAFLVALHPSLAPLTDPLLAAGITSDRSLALFAGMERSSRHALYEDLRIEGDMPMLDAAAVEALDEACSRAQATQWAIKYPL